MKTIIIEDINEIRSRIPKSKKLVDSANSSLPFHQLKLSDLWWQHFNSNNGKDFAANRGRNFYGSKSWLEWFKVILIEDHEEIVGLAPLVLFNVKIRGKKENIKLITFAGDSVLIPYQDFLVSSDNHEDILNLIVKEIESLILKNNAILLLNYFPEYSKSLPVIIDRVENYQKRGWQSNLFRNKRHGGVYPWSINLIKKYLKEIYEKVKVSNEDRPDVQELLQDLTNINPAFLNFQETRKKIESRVYEILNRYKNDENYCDQVTGILEQLNPKKIIYPFIELPTSRENYLQSLSRETRRYFKRYGKRFIEAGGSFEKIKGDAISNNDISDYLKLHSLRWNDASAILNDKTIEFLHCMAYELSRDENFTIFFARHNDKRIASHSCIDIFNRREAYLNGRDPEFEELRAGRLLYMETILDAIDNQFSLYDLGYGGDNYKFAFTKQVNFVKNLLVNPFVKSIDIGDIFSNYECFEID